MSAGAKGHSIYSIVDNSYLLKRIHVLDSYKDAIEPTKSVAPKNYDILESALRKLYYGLDETFYPPAKWHERLNYIFSKEIPFTGIELDLVFVRNSLDQSKLDKTFYFNESLPKPSINYISTYSKYMLKHFFFLSMLLVLFICILIKFLKQS